MTASERIRKHRAKLRAEQCGRLDVFIGAWIVEGIRQLAETMGRATWEEVQDVLEQRLIAEGVVPAAQPSCGSQTASARNV